MYNRRPYIIPHFPCGSLIFCPYRGIPYINHDVDDFAGWVSLITHWARVQTGVIGLISSAACGWSSWARRSVRHTGTLSPRAWQYPQCRRLEEVGYYYASRLPVNNVLRKKITHRLTRHVGRLSLTKAKRLYEDFHFQAQSCEDEYKVAAKIEWHLEGLFSRMASSSPTCRWSRIGR
jgi:hypothetical protein